MGFTVYFSLIFLLIFGGVLFMASWVLSRSGRRGNQPLLLLLGLLALALLLTPLEPLTAFYQTNFLFPLLGVPIILALSTLLLLKAIRIQDANPDQTNQEEGRASWEVRVSLLVSGLLLLVTTYRLFWFLVWDSTYDPIGALFFLPLLAAASACGLLLAITLRESSNLMRLVYLAAFPALVVGTYILANQIDFRQLTEERMVRIGEAVEAYYARQGRYPQNLNELVPRDLLAVPRPVFIYGQDWCYQASEGSFQLAYVRRDHWSSPYLSASAYHPGSEPGDLESLCEPQIAAQQQRRPWSSWQMVNTP